MPILRFLPLVLTAALPLHASANTSPQETMISRFSSIALPIAKGAVLEDNKGCFWWVREGEKTPEISALVDDQSGTQLCRMPKDHVPVRAAREEAGGARE
ncbi:hypothetical protein [Pseudomonas aeruginosa]|uniref:hypothetical protein n=1 Tax=Pseudomonas aeruginosa TaxID=287 RepID=UPI000FFF60CE|nr:hypothetical protein [Pseudomonas aeruginosa]MBA5106046.1 hypothetical protein [Pseudomonas aeruginosa]MDP5993436.1 hypothetical protein [Pseudomonas aeruginosa]HCE9175699.1 hypothetical protein [Pseudomonas aeruginosa]HEJ9771314.1 hypothetical protein [Pseudomonas aeruginosa]HEO1611736.1 hypothetical protein [Pseudomonas aeruginosa]